MEVHHHPQVERKRFKEYFLEGLMIFLAVSMGFIAENIREKITENGRAKELAESLYQEVYNDSVALQKAISYRMLKEKELANFIAFAKDSSLANISHRFYRSLTWSFLIVTSIYFEPADGMISQLRNSGSLRYFKSNKLQEDVGNLGVIITKVRNRMENENSYSHEFIRPFILKFYDFSWQDEITKQNSLVVTDALINEPDPKTKPVINNLNAFNKIEAVNIASYYLLILRSSRIVQLKNYMTANHTLLETLRKEYNLADK